jgi:hypothetical protein
MTRFDAYGGALKDRGAAGRGRRRDLASRLAKEGALAHMALTKTAASSSLIRILHCGTRLLAAISASWLICRITASPNAHCVTSAKGEPGLMQQNGGSGCAIP